MRIVVYNFVQPGDAASKQGGGVAVYQNNLLRELRTAGHKVIMLSSGDRYRLRPTRASLRSISDEHERAIVIDSPVFAPAHYTFHRIARYYEDPGLDHIPAEFRARYGSVDVFHFQNVEGLTAGFFRALRREYPEARLLLSAHNYNFVCPQVNLWYREHKACDDYRDGRSCVNCLVTEDLSGAALNLRRLETVLRSVRLNPDMRAGSYIVGTARAAARVARYLAARLPVTAPRAPATLHPLPITVTSDEQAAAYRHYRETNLDLARNVFDRVLAVSARTRQVLIERGVAAEKVAVSYIGTAHYSKFETAEKIVCAHGHVHLAFLGYMRADKGFFFFLEALQYLDENVAKHVSVTIAAPARDRKIIERLRSFSFKFRNVRVYNGYSHKTLDTILDGVNLGVVPVLWEDNLPQVAIEMAARGIPLLTSDRGGSQEIGDNPDFVFKAGSALDFCAKLQRLVAGEVPLGNFWRKPTRIYSMQQHLADLTVHYRGAFSPEPSCQQSRATAEGSAVPASLAQLAT